MGWRRFGTGFLGWEQGVVLGVQGRVHKGWGGLNLPNLWGYRGRVWGALG